MDFESRLAQLETQVAAQARALSLQQDAIDRAAAGLVAIAGTLDAIGQSAADARVTVVMVGYTIAEMAALQGLDRDQFSRLLSRLLDAGESAGASIDPKTAANVLQSFDVIRTSAEEYFLGSPNSARTDGG